MGMVATDLEPFAFCDRQKSIYRAHAPGRSGSGRTFPMRKACTDFTAQAYMLFSERVSVDSLRLEESIPTSAYEDDIIALLAEAGAGIAPNI